MARFKIRLLHGTFYMPRKDVNGRQVYCTDEYGNLLKDPSGQPVPMIEQYTARDVQGDDPSNPNKKVPLCIPDVTDIIDTDTDLVKKFGKTKFDYAGPMGGGGALPINLVSDEEIRREMMRRGLIPNEGPAGDISIPQQTPQQEEQTKPTDPVKASAYPVKPVARQKATV